MISFLKKPRLTLTLVFVLASLGCPPAPTPAPVPPQPAAMDASAATCETVCSHLRALSCPAGFDTKKGVTCEAVCANTLADGVLKLNLSCMTGAGSCTAVNQCR